MRNVWEGKTNKKVGQTNVLLGYEMNFPVNKYGKNMADTFHKQLQKIRSLYAYCIWENDFEWEKKHTHKYTRTHTYTSTKLQRIRINIRQPSE